MEWEEQSSVGKAAMNVVTQEYGVFFAGCAGFCNLGARPLSAAHTVEMINSVTGAEYTLEELMDVGRRVWLLTRTLSALCGARAQDDVLPPRLARPLDSGPTAGSAPDMELMLREFYDLRGLDERGIPRSGVLTAAGLDDLVALLP
jgi:aldehyde:ferredoxin oxidoreductase